MRPSLPAAVAKPNTLVGKVATFTPLTPEEAQGIAVPWLQDPRFAEVACGLGLSATGEALRDHLSERPLIRLWRVKVSGVSRHEPVWVVYSELTTNDCVALYQPQAASLQHGYLGRLEGLSPEQSAAVFADMLDLFAGEFFGQAGGGPEYLFSHVALPIDEGIYATYIEHGWDVWSTHYLDRPELRYIFGIKREVYQMYQEPAEVDDDF
jgi:hypothetical protein